MRLASTVLVDGAPGKILCVSRYENLEDWNLPGGKREPGESSIHAYPVDTQRIGARVNA